MDTLSFCYPLALLLVQPNLASCYLMAKDSKILMHMIDYNLSIIIMVILGIVSLSIMFILCTFCYRMKRRTAFAHEKFENESGSKSTEDSTADQIFKITSGNPLSMVVVTSEKNSSSVEKLVDSKESLLEDSHVDNNSFVLANAVRHETDIESCEEKCNDDRLSTHSESPNRNNQLNNASSATSSVDDINEAAESPIKKLELRPPYSSEYGNDEESVEAVLEFLDNIIDGEDSDNEEEEEEADTNLACVEVKQPTTHEPFFEPNISKKIETSMQLFSSMMPIDDRSDFVVVDCARRDSEVNVDLTDINPLFLADDWMNYDYGNVFEAHANRPEEFRFIDERSLTFEHGCKQSNEVYEDGWHATSEPLEEVFDAEPSQDVTSAILDLRLQLEEMLPHSGGNVNEFFNQDEQDEQDENQHEEAEAAEPEPFKKQSNELLLNYKRSLSPIVEEPEAEDQPSSIRSANKMSSFNDSTTSAESSSFNALDALMGQAPRTLYASNDTLFAFEDSFNDTDIVSPRKQSQLELQKKSFEENSQARVNEFSSSHVDSEMSNADEHTDSYSTQPTEHTVGQDFTTSNEMKTCISVDKEEERLSEISEPTFDSEMSEKTDLNFDFRLPNYWCADEMDDSYANERIVPIAMKLGRDEQDVWYKFNEVNEKSNFTDTIEWENEKENLKEPVVHAVNEIPIKAEFKIESNDHWQRHSPSENIMEKSIQEGSDTLSSNSSSCMIDSTHQREIVEKFGTDSPVLESLVSERFEVHGTMEKSQSNGNSDDDSGFETLVGKKTDYGDGMSVSAILNI